MEVFSCCWVSRNDAGELVVPHLNKHADPTDPSHDFSYIQEKTKNDAIGLKNSDGIVVALADTKIQPGDALLYVDYVSDHGSPVLAVVGLLARQVHDSLYIIVGQFILYGGVQPWPIFRHPEACGCDSNDVCGCGELGTFGCTCEGEPYCPVTWSWEVYMSPEDLLLFLTQDLGIREQPAEEDVEPRLWIYVRPDRTAMRLKTSVTSNILSSYALCRKKECER